MKTFPYYGGLTYLDMAYSQAHTMRYHMCRTTRPQYLAEHASRVAQIYRVLLLEYWELRPVAPSVNAEPGSALALMEVNTEPSRHPEFWKQPERDQMELLGLKIALDHDMVETLTGDTPSHSKSPSVKREMNRVEAEVLQMVVDHDDYLLHMAPDGTALDTVVRQLIKLADLAEGLVFAHYNQGFGHANPDNKSQWVNNNWTRMAYAYIEGLDENLFSDTFKEWVRSFIIDRKLGITPQHA